MFLLSFQGWYPKQDAPPKTNTEPEKRPPKGKGKNHRPKPNHQFLLASKCSFFSGGGGRGGGLLQKLATYLEWNLQTHNEVCRIWHRSCLPNVGALWCGTDDHKKRCFFLLEVKGGGNGGWCFFFLFLVVGRGVGDAKVMGRELFLKTDVYI